MKKGDCMKISKTTVDVRYAETDQMGVVHHSNYFVWCEIGRTELIRLLGFDYSQLEKDGVLAPVIHFDLSYKVAARYGESVTISTWIEDYDGLRVYYGYEITKENGDVCAYGTSTHVCVHKDTFRPFSIKKRLPEWHKAYEENKRKK